MGITAYGNPILGYDYKEEAYSYLFNEISRDILQPGVYRGGLVTKTGDREVTVSPFVSLYEYTSILGTHKNLVRHATSSSFTSTLVGGDCVIPNVHDGNPHTYYLVTWLTWVETPANYPDYGIAGVGAIPNITSCEADSKYIILATINTIDTGAQDEISTITYERTTRAFLYDANSVLPTPTVLTRHRLKSRLGNSFQTFGVNPLINEADDVINLRYLDDHLAGYTGAPYNRLAGNVPFWNGGGTQTYFDTDTNFWYAINQAGIGVAIGDKDATASLNLAKTGIGFVDDTPSGTYTQKITTDGDELLKFVSKKVQATTQALGEHTTFEWDGYADDWRMRLKENGTLRNIRQEIASKPFIQNANFQDGLKGWTAVTTGGGSTTLTIANSRLKISGTGGTNGAYQDFETESGVQLLIEATYTTLVGGISTISLILTDGITPKTITKTEATAYTQGTIKCIYTPAAASTRITINNTTASIYISDIKVTYDIITNGDFETDYSSWTKIGSGNTTLSRVDTTSDPGSGKISDGEDNFALKIVSLVAGEISGAYQTVSGLFVGRKYRLRVKSYCANATPSINSKVGVQVVDGSTVLLSMLRTEFDTAAWVTHDGTFTATATSLDIKVFNSTDTVQINTSYFDFIVLEEAESVQEITKDVDIRGNFKNVSVTGQLSHTFEYDNGTLISGNNYIYLANGNCQVTRVNASYDSNIYLLDLKPGNYKLRAIHNATADRILTFKNIYTPSVEGQQDISFALPLSGAVPDEADAQSIFEIYVSGQGRAYVTQLGFWDGANQFYDLVIQDQATFTNFVAGAYLDSDIKTVFLKDGTYTVSGTSGNIIDLSTLGITYFTGESRNGTIIEFTGALLTNAVGIYLAIESILENITIQADNTWNVDSYAIKGNTLGGTNRAFVKNVEIKSDSGIKVYSGIMYVYGGICDTKIVGVRYDYRSCNNIVGCYGEATGHVFFACLYISNCTAQGSIDFGSCNYLTNCSTTGILSSAIISSFNGCNYLTNCTATKTNTSQDAHGFTGCTYLTDCIATITGTGISGDAIGFNSCTNLTNCKGTGAKSGGIGHGYGFYSSSRILLCYGIGTSLSLPAASWGFKTCFVTDSGTSPAVRIESGGGGADDADKAAYGWNVGTAAI